jgi:hypothetical protein
VDIHSLVGTRPMWDLMLRILASPFMYFSPGIDLNA